MSFSQQIIQFLSQPPGSFVYHVVTLLALQTTLALSIWQVRRSAGDGQARRLAFATGGILIGRLVVALALILTPDGPATGLVTILERAADAAAVALIVWALISPLPDYPRLIEVGLAIALIVFGLMAVLAGLSLGGGGTAVSGSNAAAAQLALWEWLQVGLLAMGIAFVVRGREKQFSLRLAVLLILLLAHLASALTRPAALAETEIAYWVRLGNLVALPLLAVLSYRHNLHALLQPASVRQAAAGDTGRTLRLARQAAEPLRLEQVVAEGVRMVSELTASGLTGIALLTEGDDAHLQLTMKRPGPAGQEDVENWALSLTHWPALRLALQQRQQVELVPDGVGARQLFNLYQELDVYGLGALLIAPLIVEGRTIGLLLQAPPGERARWSDADKALTADAGAYLAQLIHNVRRFEVAQATEDAGRPAGAGDSARLAALELERDRALAEGAKVRGQMAELEANWTMEQQRAEELAGALEANRLFEPRDREEALLAEIEQLRRSLQAAESALALAAAGDASLSADWVTRTVTHYSGELEDAQTRIHALENQLRVQTQPPDYDAIVRYLRALRTPLTSLNGYSDLLLGESLGILGTKQIGLLRRMKANIGQIINAVNGLGNLARSEQFKLANLSGVDPLDMIETAVTHVQTELDNKGLQLEVRIDETLPHVPSKSDSLYRMVTHLLRHACLVSAAHSKLTLAAHVDSLGDLPHEDRLDEAEFLHVWVSDQGGARSQDIYARVLAAFQQQSEDSGRPLVDRDGTHLATVLELVNVHGGRSWLEAGPNGGSTISVLLPLAADGVDDKNA